MPEGEARITNWLPDGANAISQEVHRLLDRDLAVDRRRL
jgi:hypothetical protein